MSHGAWPSRFVERCPCATSFQMLCFQLACLYSWLSYNAYSYSIPEQQQEQVWDSRSFCIVNGYSLAVGNPTLATRTCMIEKTKTNFWPSVWYISSCFSPLGSVSCQWASTVKFIDSFVDSFMHHTVFLLTWHCNKANHTLSGKIWMQVDSPSYPVPNKLLSIATTGTRYTLVGVVKSTNLD